MAFSGWSTSNYVRLGSAVAAGQPLTISVRFNPSSLAAIGFIAGLYNSGSSGSAGQFSVRVDPAGTATATFNNTAAGIVATTGNSCSTGSWSQIVSTATGTSLGVRLNGGTKATMAHSQVPSFNRTSVGRRDNSSGDLPFTGSVAEFAMWGIDLSDDEQLSLSKGFSPLLIRPQNLIVYLPLVRELIDHKGNAFAIVGSLSQADHPPVLNAS